MKRLLEVDTPRNFTDQQHFLKKEQNKIDKSRSAKLVDNYPKRLPKNLKDKYNQM